jgi:hypothetical protein
MRSGLEIGRVFTASGARALARGDLRDAVGHSPRRTRSSTWSALTTNLRMFTFHGGQIWGVPLRRSAIPRRDGGGGMSSGSTPNPGHSSGPSDHLWDHCDPLRASRSPEEIQLPGTRRSSDRPLHGRLQSADCDLQGQGVARCWTCGSRSWSKAIKCASGWRARLRMTCC